MAMGGESSENNTEKYKCYKKFYYCYLLLSLTLLISPHQFAPTG